jgi:hypothetical protein
MTPQAKPTAISQFGIFLIHKSKNAERPLTKIIKVSESANLFKTLLFNGGSLHVKQKLVNEICSMSSNEQTARKPRQRLPGYFIRRQMRPALGS